MYATDVVPLSKTRGWTRARLILEMRRAGRAGVHVHGQRQAAELPDDASLRRMLRLWSSGERGLSETYAAVFTSVFGATFSPGRPASEATAEEQTSSDTHEELTTRLALASTVDAELIALFEGQTESFRRLDRRLGAGRLLAQTESHVAQMQDLLTYSLPLSHRPALAAAVAEAAALAGWQALDLGRPDKSWLLFETAKAAARDAENPSILAHVTAEQAYALLDLGRTDDAGTLATHARAAAQGRVPALLLAWLWAAEAEALAAAGNERATLHALDTAAHELPDDPTDEALPFIFLGGSHFTRWRGNCLARLGLDEALADLTDAVKNLDPTFTRAAAGLHCDLALAYSMRGQHEEARAEAQIARDLAAQTASERQRRRIKQLLMSGATTNRKNM